MNIFIWLWTYYEHIMNTLWTYYIRHHKNILWTYMTMHEMMGYGESKASKHVVFPIVFGQFLVIWWPWPTWRPKNSVPLRLKLSLFSPWNGNFGDISTSSDCTIPVFLVGYPTWMHVGYGWLLLYLTHRNVEDRDPHVFLSFALPDFPFMDYDDLLTGFNRFHDIEDNKTRFGHVPFSSGRFAGSGWHHVRGLQARPGRMRSPYGSTKSSTHLEIAHQMTLFL